MKLYDGGKAPNPRRVQIFLAEKGIDVERVQIDLNSLEQRTDEFRGMNPMQTVPVLELNDGTVISETVAICRYFEELHPKPALFGSTALERASVEMWQRRLELGYLMPVAQSFRHLHPGGKVLEGTQVEEWGKINQGRATKFMKFLDDHLANNEFMSGNTYTIADITGIVTTQFLKPARIELSPEMTNLNRWFQQMLERPGSAW